MAAPPPALFHGLQKPKPSLRDIERAQSYQTGVIHRRPYQSGFAGPTSSPLMESSLRFGNSLSNYFSGTNSKMAYRNRRYRPRRNRRRRGRRGIRRISRAVTLWPRQKLVKMKLAFYYSTITGTGTIAATAVKANSLNDPTGSLSAQLPLGLDQWAAMYQKYVVVGSKIWARCHNVSGTGSMMYGITLKNTASTLNDYTYYLESPMTRAKMLSSDVDHSSVGISYNAKRFWHVRKFHDAEDQHGAFSTTPGDPTDIAYYHLWVHDTSTSEAQTFEMVLTQEFYVLLFDPIVPARSSLA